MLATNPDVSLDPYFKEAYCKRHPTSHPRMCNYRPQKPLNAKIPDVRLLDTPESKDIRRIVELSRKYGRLIQLNTPGFLSNLRQHRSCGLSILQMAQQARAFWLGGGKGAARKRDGGDGSKATLYFDPAGSSKDSGRQHDFGWRDFMDICVKWRQVTTLSPPRLSPSADAPSAPALRPHGGRAGTAGLTRAARGGQISEPNDPVFWIDLLAPEAFAEGFGLQTPMVTGQVAAGPDPPPPARFVHTRRTTPRGALLRRQGASAPNRLHPRRGLRDWRAHPASCCGPRLTAARRLLDKPHFPI